MTVESLMVCVWGACGRAETHYRAIARRKRNRMPPEMTAESESRLHKELRHLAELGRKLATLV